MNKTPNSTISDYEKVFYAWILLSIGLLFGYVAGWHTGWHAHKQPLNASIHYQRDPMIIVASITDGAMGKFIVYPHGCELTHFDLTSGDIVVDKSWPNRNDGECYQEDENKVSSVIPIGTDGPCYKTDGCMEESCGWFCVDNTPENLLLPVPGSERTTCTDNKKQYPCYKDCDPEIKSIDANLCKKPSTDKDCYQIGGSSVGTGQATIVACPDVALTESEFQKGLNDILDYDDNTLRSWGTNINAKQCAELFGTYDEPCPWLPGRKDYVGNPAWTNWMRGWVFKYDPALATWRKRQVAPKSNPKNSSR